MMTTKPAQARNIPLCVPNLDGNEGRYVHECISTGFVSSVGPFVTRFEAMVAEASAAQHAVATSSGTCGLHVALVAAGVRPGDLVLIPSFTFIATANAVAHCGAVPWLLDIAAEDWCLDLSLAEQVLESETRRAPGGLYHRATGQRIAAIMPVYTLGLVPDMSRLRRLAARYALPVVADAAPALGARSGGRPCGGLADLSVFSFNGNKTVTSGGGGAVVGDDAALLAHVRHLSTTARVDGDYNHDAVGFNYRMTNLEAAVGCAQLESLSRFEAAKRRIRDTYRRGLADIPGLGFFPEAPGAENACWLSGIVVPPDGPSVQTICRGLAAEGIQARAFWKPVHLQAPFAGAPRTAMPVTDALWSRTLTLPCSTALTEEDQAWVIAKTRIALHG
jgi:perosamine synthetase